MFNQPKKPQESSVQLYTLGKTIRDPYMNTICLIFICSQHRQILLRKYYELNTYWFPFIWAQTNTKVLDLVYSILTKLKSCPFSIESIIDLHHCRVEISPQKFVYRKTVQINIQPNQGKCCSNFSEMIWFSLDTLLNLDLSKSIDNFFGKVESLLRIVTQESPKRAEELRFKPMENFISKSNGRNEHWIPPVCLINFQVTESDWTKLYQEFMEFTFPIFHMTPHSFVTFISKFLDHSTQSDFYLRLFNAFDQDGNECLTFIEFVMGLAQLEWNCVNDIKRAHFVFRFYDINRKKILDQEQLHILKKDLENVNLDVKIRISQTTFEEMFLSRAEYTKLVRYKTSLAFLIVASNLVREDKYRKVLDAIKPFKLNPAAVFVTSKGIKCLQNILHSNLQRSLSLQLQTETNILSDLFVIIKMIKGFDLAYKDIPNRTFLSENVRYTVYLLNKLGKMFEKLRKYLLFENRLVHIQSPCYVHGDIVGSITDLISLHELLMSNFPAMQSRHIFLGNYFGEKPWGLECFIFLTCLKLIAPDKIFLLMGNNELNTKKIEEQCYQKYGCENGRLMSNLFKEILPYLPLCTVIDNQIFCSNSNILNDSLLKINKLPTPTSDILSNSIGQQLFCQTLSDDEKIKQFLTANSYSHMIRSNTSVQLNKTLHNRNIQIGLAPKLSTSSYQLVTVQVVRKNIRILSKKKANLID